MKRTVYFLILGLFFLSLMGGGGRVKKDPPRNTVEEKIETIKKDFKTQLEENLRKAFAPQGSAPSSAVPASPAQSSDVALSKIVIDASRSRGPVNKLLFGNNLLGYDPVTVKFSQVEYPGHTAFGEGIWDPRQQEIIPEILNAARDVGITVLRFPGGCGAHYYDWKQAVGPGRAKYVFGIDEFLKVTEGLKAEAVFTISDFIGNEQDAADLVEYLNAPNNGSNPNGGRDWAAERARNGHPAVYNVKYFEIGNETYHGNHQDRNSFKAGDYAALYLRYYHAMKAVDPSIQLGVVLFTQDWNREVMSVIKEKVDFGIHHTYPSPEVDPKVLARMKPKDIFEITYLRPVTLDRIYLHEVSKLLREKAGRDIPYAVTEYNGGFVQDHPLPYRFTLGTALLNAEMLRIFMQEDHSILMANYWNFSNEYWGMVRTSDFLAENFRQNIKIIKRPSYYVYELYHRFFGDTMVSAEVQTGSYRISEAGYKTIRDNIRGFAKKDEPNIPAIPYLSVNASRRGDQICVMVINRNLEGPMTTQIRLENFDADPVIQAWVLNGPNVEATNESKTDNVKIKEVKLTASGNPVEVVFEPHSLTALVFSPRK